jgi:hypothetical protein
LARYTFVLLRDIFAFATAGTLPQKGIIATARATAVNTAPVFRTFLLFML